MVKHLLHEPGERLGRAHELFRNELDEFSLQLENVQRPSPTSNNTNAGLNSHWMLSVLLSSLRLGLDWTFTKFRTDCFAPGFRMPFTHLIPPGIGSGHMVCRPQFAYASQRCGALHWLAVYVSILARLKSQAATFDLSNSNKWNRRSLISIERQDLRSNTSRTARPSVRSVAPSRQRGGRVEDANLSHRATILRNHPCSVEKFDSRSRAPGRSTITQNWHVTFCAPKNIPSQAARIFWHAESRRISATKICSFI